MHFRGAIQITAAIRGLATRARPGYAKKEMMKTLKKNMSDLIVASLMILKKQCHPPPKKCSSDQMN